MDAWTAPEATPPYTWTQRITAYAITGTQFADGGFEFSSSAGSRTFDNVKIGYDKTGTPDDDIDDDEDWLVYSEDFAATYTLSLAALALRRARPFAAA